MHQRDYYFGTGAYAADAFKNTSDEKKLSAAIDKNDIKYVQDYIARGGDVNVREIFEGHLPRHPVLARAATKGRTEIVEALLKGGAEIHQEWQFDAFVEAAREGKVKTVEAFIKAGIDVNKSPFALNRAIAFNQPEVVKLLIAAKADLSDALAGSGPLRADERLTMVQLLLNGGANTEGRDYVGYTRLMTEHDPEVVRLLLKHGADFNAQGGGKTVLQAVIDRRPSPDRDAIIQQLLDAGADPKAANSRGKNAIDSARDFRDAVTLKKLDPAFDLSRLPDDAEVKAFVEAAGKSPDAKIVQAFLTKHGADYVDVRHERLTGFENACLYQRLDVIRLLHAHGADIDRRSTDSNTLYNRKPVNVAMDLDRPQVIKCLVRLGADIDHEAQETARLRGFLPIIEREAELKAAFNRAQSDPAAPKPVPLREEVGEFFTAVRYGDMGGVTSFLDRFGDAHTDNDGVRHLDSALIEAAQSGSEAMTQEMPNRGAQITEHTMMRLASNDRNLQMFGKLAAIAPQFITDPPSSERSMTAAAIMGNAPETLRFVLDKGAPLWAAEDGRIYEEEMAKYMRRPDLVEIIKEAAGEREAPEPPPQTLEEIKPQKPLTPKN